MEKDQDQEDTENSALPPTAGDVAQEVVDRLGDDLARSSPDELAEKILTARKVSAAAIAKLPPEFNAWPREKTYEAVSRKTRGQRKRTAKKKGEPVLGGLMARKLEKTAARVLDTMVLEGELPADFLLRIMRSKKHKLAIRIQCAQAVAPYIHPRLAFIQHKNKRDPDDLSGLLQDLERERKRLSGGRRGAAASHSLPLIDQIPPRPVSDPSGQTPSSPQSVSCASPDPTPSSPPSGPAEPAASIPGKSPDSSGSADPRAEPAPDTD